MRLVAAILVLSALGVGVIDGGGFDPSPQWSFAGLAGAAALAAVMWRPPRALRLVRTPVVLVLFAIGAVSALSAAWTIAPDARALQAGALAAGYGALALAVAVIARPAGDIAATVSFTAAATALSGIVSVALFSDLYAERVSHQWQAEGPLGYAPALALLQVAALPALLSAMTRARLALSVAASVCIVLAAGAIVLAANRLSVALTVALLGVALLVPTRTIGARRLDLAAAAALMALAGLAVHLALGGRTPLKATGEGGRLLLLLVIVGASATAWGLFRDWSGARAAPPPRDVSRRVVVGVAIGVAAVAVLVGVFSATSLGERTAAHGSFTHGRVKLWRISWDQFTDRPLQGYGAGSFLNATLQRQAHASRQRLTVFAHDRPLELAVELGIAGLVLGIALYLAAAHLLWRVRGSPEAWLLGPGAAAFLIANLVDWPWHLAGVGAVFSLCLGGLIAARQGMERVKKTNNA